MSTITQPPRPVTTSPEGSSPYDLYIEQQLDRTRRDVQLVDFFSSLMVLAAWFLGTLLVAAIIDHWLFALPVWFRWLLFCGLLGGAVWHVGAAILPLLVKPLNPVYVARTIEQSQPSLKNSLINFLLFRADRAGLRSSVYETLKQRAATDLTHVPVDTAVDRTHLIHIGYVLIAVLVAFAAYTVASPKSPFRSVYRVVAPWSDTPRPSRVRIEEVVPGDQRVFHGDRIRVSARCYDVYEGEPVQLFYSSLDGRISKQVVFMQTGEDRLIYRAQLPPEDDGIQQDLVYWIEAGDAVTAAYRLTVVPAPTILVQRVEYDYPAYTGQAKKVVERQPDLEGLEGTRVTLQAQANQPIRWAAVVFDPPSESRPPESTARAGASGAAAAPVKLPMQVDGNRASVSFVLELDPQRGQALHGTYQLQFETTEGQQNSRIPIHRIVVTRDLAPEIEILTPTQDRLELPVDRSQKIELRAIDPDFGLRRMTLRAAAGGKELVAQHLLDQPAGQAGQVVGSYEFRPAAHALRPGETLLYWGTAEDTRCQPMSGEPEPNVAKTRAYQITILPPENVGTPEPAGPREEPTPDQSGVSQESPPPGPTDQPSSAQGNQKPQPGEQPGEAGQGNPADNPSPESAGNSDSQGGSSADSAGSAGQSGGSRGQDSSSAAGGSQGAGQSGSSGDQTGSGQSAGSGDQGQGSASGANAGGSGESSSSGGDRQGSSAGSPGESPSAGDSGSSPSPGGSSASPASGQAGADSTGQPGENAEPLHDGEVFERTLEYLQSQRPSGSPTDPGADNPSQSKPSPDGNSQTQPAGGQPGDSAPNSSGQDSPNSTPSGGTQGQQPGMGQQGSSSQTPAGGRAGSEGQAGAEKPSDTAGQASAGSSQGDSGQQDQGQPQGAPPQPGGSSQPQDSSAQPGGTGQKPSAGADSGASRSPSQPAGGQDSPQPSSPAMPKPSPSPSSAAGQSGSPPSGSEPKPAEQPRGSGEGQQQQPGAGQQPNQGGGSQPNESQGGSAGGQKQEPNSGQSSAPSGSGQPKPGQEPQAPGVSKKQSSSGGDSQGDRSGGGKQGGGQGGNQPGQGSPGSQTPADAGQGAADPSGSGQSANRPGDRPGAQSDDGTPGAQKGYGSTTQPTPGGTGQGGAADSPSSLAPNSDAPPTASPSVPDVNRRGQGVPMGGGQPSAAELHGPDATGEVPPGDQPNLEYSRKATDLVLEYLKDQQQNPDPGLLDRLGWTREELQQFLTRWEALRRSARQDPAAGRDLDEALRSLGLRVARPQTRSAGATNDAVRGLRDPGLQSAPPASYLDQFRAYKKGTARTEGN